MVLTRQAFAELLGVTPSSVSRLIAEGMPGIVATGSGRGHHTKIDASQALPWIVGRRVPQSRDDERQRYFRLQGDKIDLEIRRRVGELVEAADVEHRWAAMVSATRERLLSLPGTALQRGLIATSAAEDGLIALVDEALLELAARGSTP